MDQLSAAELVALLKYWSNLLLPWEMDQGQINRILEIAKALKAYTEARK
jgi:hypothetical protein